jgi:hypothetical protein
MWAKFIEGLLSGPFLGGLTSALATILVGAFVVRKFNSFQAASKGVEAVATFNTEFRALMDERNRLNSQAYRNEDVDGFFRRFFDLQLNQYNFFRAGIIPVEIYAEWVLWRWAAAKKMEDANLDIGPREYMTEWKKWSSRKVIETNPFVAFMNKAYDEPDQAGVRAVVRRAAPSWWR